MKIHKENYFSLLIKLNLHILQTSTTKNIFSTNETYILCKKKSLNKLLTLNIFIFRVLSMRIKETKAKICAVCTLSLAAEYFSWMTLLDWAGVRFSISISSSSNSCIYLYISLNKCFVCNINTICLFINTILHKIKERVNLYL